MSISIQHIYFLSDLTGSPAYACKGPRPWTNKAVLTPQRCFSVPSWMLSLVAFLCALTSDEHIHIGPLCICFSFETARRCGNHSGRQNNCQAFRSTPAIHNLLGHLPDSQALPYSLRFIYLSPEGRLAVSACESVETANSSKLSTRHCRFPELYILSPPEGLQTDIWQQVLTTAELYVHISIDCLLWCSSFAS